MKVAVVKERRAHERRIAASPDSVKRMVGIGLRVAVESGAGEGAGISDSNFVDAGSVVAKDEAGALADADLVLKVQRPILGDAVDELRHLKRGAALIGLLQPLEHPAEVEAYAGAGIAAFAMELVPRITRAQSMDVLSSQANLAGYKAVIDAAEAFGRAFPMMMTAAGTIKAARVLVMGAGVAGLQAIATARRLGAIVSATDVRAAAKEQVESLGATFLTVDENAARSAETAGGYAREMGEDYQRRQRERIGEALRRTDVVICTALVPGRPAPLLLTEAMIGGMARGSVVVDLAVEAGGNVEGSRLGETVTTANGVTILGHANVPSRIAADASQLYARNLFAFLQLIVDQEGALRIDRTDEIVGATLLTFDGVIVNPALGPAKTPAKLRLRMADEAAMANPVSLSEQLGSLATDAAQLAHNLDALARQLAVPAPPAAAGAGPPFVFELTVFVLAVFVGYHVVWRVTPALHSPLMSVTNAISSVIIVGALIAAGPFGLSFAKIAGFVAVTLATVNIFGGFIVTQRMLQMFQRRK